MLWKRMCSDTRTGARQSMVYLFCLIIIPSFLYSKSLITISFLIFFLASFCGLSRLKLKRFIRSEYAFFALLFVVIALSGIYSANEGQWLHHLKIKLPFAAIPLAFYLLPRIDRTKVYLFHWWLLMSLTLASLPVMVNIGYNLDDILNALSLGQPIVTPIEHVKYSMFNAYGIMAGIVLLVESKWLRSTIMRKLTIFMCLWLFIYMHILTVRTGLVIIYLSLFFYWATWALRTGKAKEFLLICSVLVASGWVSIYVFPTLNNKVGYVLYDFKMFTEGRGENYSDSDRWQSYLVGMKVFKENPVLGVGMGDLKDECTSIYSSEFDRPGYFKYPHNQFLFILGGTGLIGMIFFLIGFYGPLLVKNHFRDSLLWILYLNYTLSFLVENSLERSFSLAFFLFFTLVILSSHDSESL